MNTAALLGPYHADRVLAWENGHSITYGHFLSDVGALDQPGVVVPPTMLVLSSQVGSFRERVAGPRDCCEDVLCCSDFSSVPS